MLAGATGTRIHPIRTIHVALQEQLAVDGGDPARVCRPFDLHRRGLVLGEGAGAIVLEELASAQARGAAILGEVAGYGSSTRVEPNGVGASDVAVENALRQSLRTSGLEPPQIGHIHAHGAATRKGDYEEAQAFLRVFGETVPPVTAAKSYFGNLGAGSGLVELIASLLACQHHTLFPILNYHTPDPDCPIRAAREGDAPGNSFVNVNYTPQAQASAVVIKQFA
jgi:3-oxoacyl-[acyl-carrier-protein] synthase II